MLPLNLFSILHRKKISREKKNPRKKIIYLCVMYLNHYNHQGMTLVRYGLKYPEGY